jgi:hypothetical protein
MTSCEARPFRAKDRRNVSLVYLKEYDVETKPTLADLTELLDQLLDRGLIEVG